MAKSNCNANLKDIGYKTFTQRSIHLNDCKDISQAQAWKKKSPSKTGGTVNIQFATLGLSIIASDPPSMEKKWPCSVILSSYRLKSKFTDKEKRTGIQTLSDISRHMSHNLQDLFWRILQSQWYQSQTSYHGCIGCCHIRAVPTRVHAGSTRREEIPYDYNKLHLQSKVIRAMTKLTGKISNMIALYLLKRDNLISLCGRQTNTSGGQSFWFGGSFTILQVIPLESIPAHHYWAWGPIDNNLN